MFCALILLPYIKSSIYSMADNNYNNSSHNSEFETELPNFSTLKLFDMEPKKSFITAGVNAVGFVNRLKQTEAVVSNVLQNRYS